MELMNLLLIISLLIIPGSALGCYNSFFSFGDSLTDTGNFVPSSSPGTNVNCVFSPYGETYFHYPTGRCSNGRLVIDFIAESLGLPLLPPYAEIKQSDQSFQNFKSGVNFAVAGATALDPAFLEETGSPAPITNCSLRIQMDWFKDVLSSLCNTTSECSKLLSSSLISIGGIGANDYNIQWTSGTKSIDKVYAYVPLVVEVIASAINELIELGASTILVPGGLPNGCIPAFLTVYATSDKNQYNTSTGCLNWLNEFSEYHNEQLLIGLSRIGSLHPHVNIVYADYYNAMLQLYQYPEQYGFIGDTKFLSCCGGGGRYNFNSSATCASPKEGRRACENPAEFISWDGEHSTEEANRWIARGTLQGKYTFPSITTSCVSQL